MIWLLLLVPLLILVVPAILLLGHFAMFFIPAIWDEWKRIIFRDKDK